MSFFEVCSYFESHQRSQAKIRFSGCRTLRCESRTRWEAVHSAPHPAPHTCSINTGAESANLSAKIWGLSGPLWLTSGLVYLTNLGRLLIGENERYLTLISGLFHSSTFSRGLLFSGADRRCYTKDHLHGVDSLRAPSLCSKSAGCHCGCSLPILSS